MVLLSAATFTFERKDTGNETFGVLRIFPVEKSQVGFAGLFTLIFTVVLLIDSVNLYVRLYIQGKTIIVLFTELIVNILRPCFNLWGVFFHHYITVFSMLQST